MTAVPTRKNTSPVVSPDPDLRQAFPTDCPLREILNRVGDQWSFLTIAVLETGQCRFGELRHRIGNISPRVLTQTLRNLEFDGLIHREPYATIPPRVDYSITELGLSLAQAMKPLINWANEHEEIYARRHVTSKGR